MRPLVFAILALLALSFGCLNMYVNTINNNCDDNDKYKSSYEKIDCLGEKSRYLAAFGEKDRALEVCKEIEDKFIDPYYTGEPYLIGTAVGNNFNIFPSHAVTMYNSCIKEVAIASRDAEVCNEQRVPSVFSAIGNIFSAVPSFSSDALAQANSQGCRDDVEFKIEREEGLGELMSRFMTLMTTEPDK